MAQVGLRIWAALCFVTGILIVVHEGMMEPWCDDPEVAGWGSGSGSVWEIFPTESDKLKVAVVADLHLAGPGTAWVDRVRRESFMRSTFQSAYRILKPDALIVLGDVSDAGRRSNNAQWNEVVSRFQSLVHPFVANPIHVVVGNHDVGDHHDPGFSSRLPRFAASFPGLDSTCGSRFALKGVDFVSLNAMAMHGDGCSVCSSVESSIENTMASLKQNTGAGLTGQSDARTTGPVLLLHLPLYRRDDNACSSSDIPRCAPWHKVEGNCIGVTSPYPVVPPKEEPHRVGQDVLSQKASAHLLESLKPRLVFSGHTHRWCDIIHADGTREITVPSLSWRNRNDPSFVMATVHTNSSITVQRCMLANESTMIVLYIIWGLVTLSWLLATTLTAFNQMRHKSMKPE